MARQRKSSAVLEHWIDIEHDIEVLLLFGSGGI
jgi:hypothetical protein